MPKDHENPFQSYEDYMAKGPFQTIKLLLPFLPAADQKTMVILIKFLELKYTMDFFRKGNRLSFCSNMEENASPLEKISSVIDFLPPKEQESMEQLLSMMSVMEAFQAMNDEDSDDAEQPANPEEEPDRAENFHQEEPDRAETPKAQNPCPGQPEKAPDSSAAPNMTICSNIHF